MEAAIDKTYRGVRFFLDVIVANCAAVVLLGATILALVEIIRRYLFGVVFDWGQDAVTYYMVAAVFIFCSVTQARRSHLAMSAAMDVLRVKGFEKLVLVVRTLVTAINLVLFSWAKQNPGYRVLDQDIQAVRGKTVFPWAPVEEGIEV